MLEKLSSTSERIMFGAPLSRRLHELRKMILMFVNKVNSVAHVHIVALAGVSEVWVDTQIGGLRTCCEDGFSGVLASFIGSGP